MNLPERQLATTLAGMFAPAEARKRRIAELDDIFGGLDDARRPEPPPVTAPECAAITAESLTKPAAGGDRRGSVDEAFAFVRSLLRPTVRARAEAGQLDIEGQLRHRSLLLAGGPSDAQQQPAVAERRRRAARRRLDQTHRAGARRLTKRERRRLGGQLTAGAAGDGLHDAMEGLRDAWGEYVQQLLARHAKSQQPDRAEAGAALHVTASAAQTALSGCDLHGATLAVARSPSQPSRVGVRGTVVEETAAMLRILTPEGALAHVPKKRHVFRMDVPGTALSVLLHGDSLHARDARGGA